MEDDGGSGMEECVICLDILDDDVQTLSCYHTFHMECLKIYSKYNELKESKIACPICKQVISYSSEHNVIIEESKKISVVLLSLFLICLFTFIFMYHVGFIA